MVILDLVNIAAMTAQAKATLTDGQKALVSGYTTANDGGGGPFYWQAGSSTATDGGTVFAADEGGTGRWNRIFSGPVNVRWFGAKGDGATNDTTAIQATIDALNLLGGGVLSIPKGTYKITSALNLISNIIVDGAGMGVAVITCANGDINHFVASSKLNVVIRDLTIDVTAAGTTSVIGGVKFQDSNNCIAERLEIKGVSWAGVLIMDTSSYCKVSDCYMHDWHGTVQDAADVAIYSSAGAPFANVVMNNVLLGGGWHGVFIQDPVGTYKPQANVILGNRIGEHDAYGIIDYGVTDGNHNTQIIGNYIENIQGKALSGSSGAGIYLVGVGGDVVEGNRVHNCCVQTTTFSLVPAGIGVNGALTAVQPILVSGNVITGMSKFVGGIMVANGSSIVDLIGNMIDVPASNTSGQAAILVTHANNVRVEGNMIKQAAAASGSGIFFYADNGSYSGFAAVGNTIEGGTASIRFDRASAHTISDIVVVGNTCRNGANTAFPLDLAAVNHGLVSGNLFSGSNNTATIRHQGCTKIRYTGNVVRTTGTVGLLFNGANTGTRWDHSNFYEGAFSNSGTGLEFCTSASGASTINSGTTSKAVNHTLAITPAAANISVIFTEQGTNDYGRWWLSNITSTQFTVNVSANPGASNLDFSWQVMIP